MEKIKIYPYIIEKNRLAGYYAILLDNKFQIKKHLKYLHQEHCLWIRKMENMDS